jgi:hypothetical protein
MPQITSRPIGSSSPEPTTSSSVSGLSGTCLSPRAREVAGDALGNAGSGGSVRPGSSPHPPQRVLSGS